jgi:hypothetical protein
VALFEIEGAIAARELRFRYTGLGKTIVDAFRDKERSG